MTSTSEVGDGSTVSKMDVVDTTGAPSQSTTGTASMRPRKAVWFMPDQSSQTFSTAGPYDFCAGGAQLELVAGAELVVLGCLGVVDGASPEGLGSLDGSLTVWPSGTGTITPPKLARPPPGPPNATAPAGMMTATAPETSTTSALDEGLTEETLEAGAVLQKVDQELSIRLSRRRGNLRCEVELGSTGGMGVRVAEADDDGGLDDMVELEKLICRLTLASVDGRAGAWQALGCSFVMGNAVTSRAKMA